MKAAAIALTRRIIWAIGTVLVVSLAIFVLVQVGGGEIARMLAGEGATDDAIREIERHLGLDRPLLVRYFEWVQHAAAGDLGASLLTNEPISAIIARGLPVTLSLILVALTFSVVVGLAAGLIAASRAGSLLDRAISAVASAGVAVPSFVIALVFVRELAVERPIFPAIGYTSFAESPASWLQHLALPALALSGITVGEITRHLRSSAVGVLAMDYILTAHAKGLSQWAIITKHTLRNAALPVITILGIRFSQMLGSTVIVEHIFVMRGAGSSLVSATQSGDVTVVLAVTVVATALVVGANLVVDLSYVALNPKLRKG